MLIVYRKRQEMYPMVINGQISLTKWGDGTYNKKRGTFLYKEKIFKFDKAVPKWLQYQAHVIIDTEKKIVIKSRDAEFKYKNTLKRYPKLNGRL